MCKTVQELGGTPPSFDHFVHGYETDYPNYYRTCGVSDAKAVKGEILPIFLRHAGPTDDTPPFPDVREFLTYLRNLEVKIFVVSSHPTDKLHTWFTTHGIDDQLLCIHGGSRDKRACLLNACREVGVRPDAAMYVGDWGLDMRAALAAGPLPIGITRGHDSRAGLIASGAVHVVDHLPELANMIR